ncbi:hypothetical protein BDF20DRAFT_286790 [Mycotypha africana]|uniref:uncharacterized protein n=1 Tax=Mycotypha africana TaxID=64632 RepID=UPI002301D0EF|nr:uncharacterized protein BDF20DRAFT_286790 [Mycotypha africana]KAI8987743.1 hypothetical protein BDF20DRAFT_286790 [Mycotypha africana]
MLSFWKKRTVPELPERDQIVLDEYTRKMKKYEEMIKICCCWIGYDVLFEFIPVVGKVISLGFAISMFRLACQCELPTSVKRRMLYHITVDFLIGLIPILGFFLTMLYRAHSKNARILRKFLYERARQGAAKAEKEALKIGHGNEHIPLSEPTDKIMERDELEPLPQRPSAIKKGEEVIALTESQRSVNVFKKENENRYGPVSQPVQQQLQQKTEYDATVSRNNKLE